MHTPTFNLVGTTFLFPLTFLEGFCSCLQQQQATCSLTWVNLCDVGYGRESVLKVVKGTRDPFVSGLKVGVKSNVIRYPCSVQYSMFLYYFKIGVSNVITNGI